MWSTCAAQQAHQASRGFSLLVVLAEHKHKHFWLMFVIVCFFVCFCFYFALLLTLFSPSFSTRWVNIGGETGAGTDGQTTSRTRNRNTSFYFPSFYFTLCFF